MTTTKRKEISKDIGIIIDHWNAVVKTKTGKTLNLEINKESTIDEVLKIETNFMSNLGEFKRKGKKIKNIIVGEATQSLENFIYNAEGVPGNVFLAKDLLSKEEKELKAEPRGQKLRKKLQHNGTLILDLYLLPLPSFMYNDYLLKTDDDGWDECLEIYKKYWNHKLSGFEFEDEVNVYVGFEKLRTHSVFTRFKRWIQEFLENKEIQVKGVQRGNKDVPFYKNYTKELFHQNKSD